MNSIENNNFVLNHNTCKHFTVYKQMINIE